MENKEILQGILYTTLGNAGPEVKYCYPENCLDAVQLNLIPIKTSSLLTGEEGEVPERIAIITFAKYKLIGLVKFFEVNVEGARGGANDSNLSILFNEEFSSIAYKYSENFEPLLKEVSKRINEFEMANNDQKIGETVKELYESLLQNLVTLQEAEKRALTSLADKKPSFRFKIVVIGDPSVGKTTLILRYVDNAFRKSYLPTIGVNVSVKKVLIDDKVVSLSFFDVAGQQEFRLMRRSFYQGVDGALIIFDVTNRDSFQNLEHWISDVGQEFPTKVPRGFVVGNKIDRESDRVITKEDGMKIAQKYGLNYVETSAKNGENVNDTFLKLAEMIKKK